MKRQFAAFILCLVLPVVAYAFDLSLYEINDISGTAADLNAGHVTDRFSLEGHPYRLFSTGGVYIGFHENEGNPAQFMLYDNNLTCFARGQVPSDRAELCSLCPDGDAVIVSMILPMKSQTQFLAARIGMDGQLDWQYMADYNQLGDTNIALPDGAGGAWLSAQVVNHEDYDPYAGTRLTHLNSHGETEFSRILKTGKEILLVQTALSDPENSSVTLYCSLVAKSKNVYTALAITLDSSGNILDTQARDFSMSQDTDFTCRIDERQKPWVFSRGDMYYGGKGILVSFDDLPSLPPSQLSFQ